MEAEIKEHSEDLEKAQAALAAATSAAEVDVRAKGGGAVLEEMTRQRRRVSRAVTALAVEVSTPAGGRWRVALASCHHNHFHHRRRLHHHIGMVSPPCSA